MERVAKLQVDDALPSSNVDRESRDPDSAVVLALHNQVPLRTRQRCHAEKLRHLPTACGLEALVGNVMLQMLRNQTALFLKQNALT